MPALAAELSPRAGEAIVRGKQHRTAAFDGWQAFSRCIENRPTNAGVPDVEGEEEFFHA
jgi:hypothetical protein